MPAGVKKIKYAVWSAINGQDDLQWYTPENLAYLSSADISNHKNDTGAYYVHTYVTMENGTSRFLTGGSFAVTGISCDSVNIENENDQDGTFEVKIKNVKSPANIERVRVAVWTKRNGLCRYRIINQKDYTMRMYMQEMQEEWKHILADVLLISGKIHQW